MRHGGDPVGSWDGFNDAQHEPNEERGDAYSRAAAVIAGMSGQRDELATNTTAFAAAFLGQPVTVRRLSGEREVNLLVRGASGDCFVLKLAEPGSDVAQAEYEVAALEYLMQVAPDLPVPRVVRSVHPEDGGAAVVPITPISGEPVRTARVVTYIPGSPLAQSVASRRLLAELGRTLGQLDTAYAEWDRPMPPRELAWDLRTVSSAWEAFRELPGLGPSARRLVARAISRYEEHAAGVVASLPVQLIHNDANPYNVLVETDGHLGGLIDFGDLVCAPAVQDLATACAYHVGRDYESMFGDPLSLLRTLVSAYCAERPLSERELEILPDLIAARSVLTVTVSLYKSHREPGNGAYLLRNARRGWACLRQLDRLGADAADYLATAAATAADGLASSSEHGSSPRDPLDPADTPTPRRIIHDREQ